MAINTDPAGHTVEGRVCYKCEMKKCSKQHWEKFSEFPKSTHPITDPTGIKEAGLLCMCEVHAKAYRQARYKKNKLACAA